MKKLRISDGLLLPPDTVTSTLVIYGGKGMGKTNLGSVLIEELTKLGLRWCYLDPLGVTWGIRHSADGKGSGAECLILGGVHGDIPIEPTGGEVVADLVVDESVNVLIDFSRKPNGEMWSIAEKTRFVTAYARRLFMRQGGLTDGRRREPIFQILDEAARYIPQVIPHGNPELAACVSAWETLAEEGRNVGIGVCFLTQRSARMNKSVSEIADAMIAFRTVGPNSINAVMDWLGEHVPKDRIKLLVEQLRQLERGQALVVSPGWLRFEGVITIRMRETFDSSATPKPGERARKVSGKGAKPDLSKYADRMKETIERAKENDPKALRLKISELQKELQKKPAAVTATKTVQVLDEKVVKEAIEKALRSVQSQVDEHNKKGARAFEVLRMKFGKILQTVTDELQEMGKVVSPGFPLLTLDTGGILNRPVSSKLVKATVAVIPTKAIVAAKPQRVAPLTDTPRIPLPITNNGLPNDVLRVLAEFEAIGRKQINRHTLAACCGKSVGGYFNNTIGGMKTQGLVDYPSGGTVALTEAGREKAPAVEISLTNADVLANALTTKVASGLGGRILKELHASYPESVSREELSERVGARGGYYNNTVGALKTAEFVSYPSKGSVKCADWFFIEEKE